MSHYERTMENCRAFLLSHPMVEIACENLPCSSCSGFEVTLKNGYCVKIRVDKVIDYVIFETCPGIQARAGTLNMTAEYCQHATPFPSPTYFAVDPEQGSVYHHSEQSFRGCPVSRATFGRMLDRAVSQTEAHYPIFQSLAYGCLPDLKALCRLEADAEILPPAEVWSSAQQAILDQAHSTIQEFLLDSGHNAVSVGLNPAGGTHFFSEIMTRDSRYRSYYCIRGGYLTVSVRMDICPGKAYRSTLARYANRISNDKKVAHMTTGPDGYPYVVVSQYLMQDEDALTEDLLEQMERITISFLHSSEDALRRIAAGGADTPEETDGEEAPRHHRAPRRDEDDPFGPLDLPGFGDDEDEDDEDDLPFSAPTPQERMRRLEKDIDALLRRVSDPDILVASQEPDEAGEDGRDEARFSIFDLIPPPLDEEDADDFSHEE